MVLKTLSVTSATVPTSASHTSTNLTNTTGLPSPLPPSLPLTPDNEQKIAFLLWLAENYGW